jgi:hypothetical protein
MAATGLRAPDPLHDLTTVAADVTSAATRAYLDGLDAFVAVHRRATSGTPFAPVTTVLEAQVEIARGVLTAFEARPGDAPATDRAEAAEQAPAELLAAAAKATTRRPRTARRATGTRSRARKPARAAAPAAAEPFAGYGDLTADELTGRLRELSQRELAAVATYERAHAARATVLERVDALQEAEPVPGYDDLTAEDAVKRLADAPADVAGRVADYERRHRARTTVLDAAGRRAEKA